MSGYIINIRKKFAEDLNTDFSWSNFLKRKYTVYY